MSSGIFYCIFIYLVLSQESLIRSVDIWSFFPFSPLLLYTSDTDVQAWPSSILA